MSIFRPQVTHKSPKWSAFRKFEIPDLDSPLETYLTRYILVRTPWFAIYVLRMDGPDSRKVLHDHPWNFFSLILRGGYTEYVGNHEWNIGPDPVIVHERHRVDWWTYKRAEDSHYIDLLHADPTWTLVFTGRRRRNWGYWDNDGKWYPFDAHPTITADFDRATRIRKQYDELHKDPS